MSYRVERCGYAVDEDAALLDVDLVHEFLARRSYLAHGIPRPVVARSIAHSLCFGLYELSASATGATGATGAAPPTQPGRPRADARQIGFARVVTDRATFAWLADVFVVEEHRGRGLAKWLVEVLLAHPDLQGLRRFVLATRDAHGLYARFGFAPLAEPARLMEKLDREVYARGDAGAIRP